MKEGAISERVIYFNGEFVPAAEARISIFDSSLFFGDMVFEATRSFNQTPFRLREHLERLYASLRYAEIDCGLTIDEMEAATHETIERNLPVLEGLDYRILHNVTRGVVPPYQSEVKEGSQPTVLIDVMSLVRHLALLLPEYENGVHFVIPVQKSIPSRYMDPKAKTRCRIHYKLADLQADRIDKGAYALLTDERGFITEGTASNFFIARDGEIFTPRPHEILRGVSRQFCMELADKLEIPLRETDIEPYDVRIADEAWRTSTNPCMTPITRFEFNPVGDGKPGPIYRKLLETWSEAVGVYIPGQAREYAELARG